MKPEKQRLLHDLLGGDEGREATLAAGARILRRRRQWRAASRGLALALALAAAGVWLERANSPKPVVAKTPQLAAVPTPARPQAFTDEQLLALFPNTPVGLVKLSDGRKRLIFPRPGDEQKFIARF